jgi:cytochrome P450
MLMHIINPKGDPTLFGRVMTEVKRAERPDGSINIPILISSPLIQSIWTETLRLSTDVLVTRNLAEDTTLPLNDEGNTFIKMKKGDSVFAPCWISQHDPKTWFDHRAPPEVFYADRFLTPDPEDPGQLIFSMTGTNGKFFPFGGGRTICPGRVFAKQEGLGALAMILLRFEFEVLGFMDKAGNTIDHFPGFADQYPGSGALTPGGDLKVKIRRRE